MEKRFTIHQYFVFVTVLALLQILPSINSDASIITNKKKIGIGILFDVEKDRPDTNHLIDQIKDEIQSLLGTTFNIEISMTNVIVCDWNASCINKEYTRLVSNSNVDIIIGIGVLNATVLAQKGTYKKPLILWGVVDPVLQNIPITKRNTSGVKNLTYIFFHRSAEKNLDLFFTIYPYKSLGIIADKKLTDILDIDKKLDGMIKKKNTTYQVISIDNIDATISQFPTDIDAVYITPLYRFGEPERKKLIDKINELKLPSFSLIGESDVKLGVLAATLPEATLQKTIRRCALDIEMILEGKNLADFPVLLDHKETLTINITTAREIDFFPKWDILSEADLIQEGKISTDRVLDLETVVSEALRANLTLKIEAQVVESSQHDVKQAKSQLLPSLDISADGTVVDEDRSTYPQAERTTSASAKLGQLIYSDKAHANVAVQHHLLKTSEFARDETSLDIVLEACTAYFDILKVKTLLKTRKDYVNLTKRNLEIAKYRESVGYSDASEVYRWESDLATAKKNLIETHAQFKLAEIQLNQVLNRPLDEEFVVKDASLDDPSMKRYGKSNILQHIDNPKSMKIFINFLVEESMNNLPEIKQLDASIAARERTLLSEKRRRWVPDVGLQSQGAYILSRDGEGSDADLPSDTQWDVGINASWPLFQGGEISSRIQQERIEIKRLKTEKRELLQNLELRVRSTVLDLISKSFNIELTKKAAAAANKNLKLVQDSYMKGKVSIVILLDAQNAAINTDYEASNSVYDYYISLLNVERAAGDFCLLKTEAEQRNVFNRFKSYMGEHQQ